MSENGDAGLKKALDDAARGAGFDCARVAPAVLPAAHSARLEAWARAGMHSEMEWMARNPAARANAETLLPDARSVIMLAAQYAGGSSGTDAGTNIPSGCVRLSSYAVGEDYHHVLRRRLEPVLELLCLQRPGHRWRIFVDSSPLLERAYAAACGVGFVGRNTMLIMPRRGSFFFLAGIATTAHIAPDSPISGTCGSCTRCIDACPTGAIVAPYMLDARRCISCLTIEKKSALTGEEARMIGRWAFGCDVCQQACPYNNKRATAAGIPEFSEGRIVRRVEPLTTFTALRSNSEFERRFCGSPLLRAGRRRLIRNAGIAAGREGTGE
ncbi:MAG: tRNA epoxyqueuosine(34) reductase QueG [bacterium]|nr:tRNA epoxyqueuosine(34) reductase QueG [Candidatus Sumerlaeota bacterium]